MKTLFLSLWIFISVLWAEPSVLTDLQNTQTVEETTEPAPEESDIGGLFSNINSTLSISWSSVPTRAYVGEIISITLKIAPAEQASGNIEYTLQNEEGIRVFSDTPKRNIKDDGVYDTFFFLVQSSDIRLPDFTATLTSTGGVSDTLTGTRINASTLNPPGSFAKILADKFEIVNYKTTPYNNESNVVIFTARVTRGNISDFSIPNAIKQGFESKTSSVETSEMTYYAIIPNNEQNLNFSYFNLKNQRYESLMIPIIVDDDTVSTQSDLSPTDERHTELKVAGAGTLILILLVLFYWRRQKWFLYLSALPVFYIAMLFLPNQDVCIKKSAAVYLLPINNGTIFETTTQEEHFEGEKVVGDFIKIHLNSDQVGWVNKRDLCTN